MTFGKWHNKVFSSWIFYFYRHFISLIYNQCFMLVFKFFFLSHFLNCVALFVQSTTFWNHFCLNLWLHYSLGFDLFKITFKLMTVGNPGLMCRQLSTFCSPSVPCLPETKRATTNKRQIFWYGSSLKDFLWTSSSLKDFLWHSSHLIQIRHFLEQFDLDMVVPWKFWSGFSLIRIQIWIRYFL